MRVRKKEKREKGVASVNRRPTRPRKSVIGVRRARTPRLELRRDYQIDLFEIVVTYERSWTLRAS